MWQDANPSSEGRQTSELKKLRGLARLSGCNSRYTGIGAGCQLATRAISAIVKGKTALKKFAKSKRKISGLKLGLQYLGKPGSKRQQEIQSKKLSKQENKRKPKRQDKLQIVQSVNQTGD